MKEVLIDNGKESGIIHLLYDYSGKGEDGNRRSYSAKLHYIHDIETNRSFYIGERYIYDFYSFLEENDNILNDKYLDRFKIKENN